MGSQRKSWDPSPEKAPPVTASTVGKVSIATPLSAQKRMTAPS